MEVKDNPPLEKSNPGVALCLHLLRVYKALKSIPSKPKEKKKVILDQVTLAGLGHTLGLSRKVLENKHPPSRLRERGRRRCRKNVGARG